MTHTTQATRKPLVQRWLREQLIRLVNVQRCTIGQSIGSSDPVRPADLVVYTWSGVLIYIHLIDESIKMPRVRRILESTTGAGIGTLFILDAALLPKHRETFEAHQWFLPLQYLANDRVYTYDLRNGNPLIRAARFVSTSRTTFEIQYSDALAVNQIRYQRQTARHNALKGYWMIADFETEVTAQNSGFRPTNGTYQQSATPGSNRSAGGTTHGAPPSRLDTAYAALGVSREATRQEVKAAFRKLAFELHPDVSHLPKDEAEARFKLLTEAYEYIKVTNDWS
jgi:DnaJ-domain-containing protein 1